MKTKIREAWLFEQCHGPIIPIPCVMSMEESEKRKKFTVIFPANRETEQAISFLEIRKLYCVEKGELSFRISILDAIKMKDYLKNS